MRSRVAAGLLVALLVAPVLAAEPDGATYERWFSMLLGGQPSGWMQSTERHEAGRITTSSETHFSIRRGQMVLNVGVESRFIETAGGQPVEASMTQKLGAMAIEQKMVFHENGIETVVNQGGVEQRQRYGKPLQAWMTPAASQRYVEKQIAAGADKIEVWTLEPANGPTPFQLVMQRNGPATTEVLGKVVPAISWTVTMSTMPGMAMSVFSDDLGRPLRTTMTPMPGMEFTVVASDRDLATAKVDPPELMVATLIRPDREVANARALRRARYKLTIAPPAEGQPAITEKSIAAGGFQQVRWIDDRHVEVVVDLNVAPTPDPSAPATEYLRPSMMLNHEDPQVSKLADQATADLPADADDARRAEAMRQFVHQFIDAKDLSVGSASASEVARTAQGDCSEHAVLLAALLRSRGIPSRTVSGLLYVDQFLGQRGVFGYHMWTQAWLKDVEGKGRWIDLDAVLQGPTSFDAAHIALNHSAMADDQMFNDLVRLVPLIGRLQVKVVEP